MVRNIDAVDGEEPIEYQSLGLAFDMRVGDVLSSSLSFARDVAAHDNDGDMGCLGGFA